MNLTKLFSVSLAAFLFFSGLNLFSQDKNKSEFIEPQKGYINTITEGADDFLKKPTEKKKLFKVDFTGIDHPVSLNDFRYEWHSETISQGLTGTCWSFSATSFFDSEIFRIHKKKIKLSPLFQVYWEYVEKAKRFVRERGDSHFGEGSEGNAVKRLFVDYGCVPIENYTGLLPGQIYHDHRKLFDEMNTYLQNVKKLGLWNEDDVVATIKNILNKYIGAPPEKFIYEGDEYTPKEFFTKVVDLDMKDYIDVLSVLEQPFNEYVEYTVPDNWWHDKSYYNIPLDVYMQKFKSAVKNGYTIAIGGDVSEPGYDSRSKCAIIPSWDIPPEYIDDNARELRFNNGTTQDDHGLHVIGYTERNGVTWFLVKDSGAGSRNVEPYGYYFYREDYVKLKIMDFMVHKDAFNK